MPNAGFHDINRLPQADQRTRRAMAKMRGSQWEKLLSDGLTLVDGQITISLSTVPALEFDGGALQAKVDADGGIVRTADGLAVSLTSTSGLETFLSVGTYYLRIKLGAAGGLGLDSDGLYVDANAPLYAGGSGLTWSLLGLESLTDPGDDRIMYWNNDSEYTDWLSVDTATLSISEGSLTWSWHDLEELTDSPSEESLLYYDTSEGSMQWCTIGEGLALDTGDRELAVDGSYFNDLFVPYDGATGDVDLGSHDLDTTGGGSFGTVSASTSVSGPIVYAGTLALSSGSIGDPVVGTVAFANDVFLSGDLAGPTSTATIQTIVGEEIQSQTTAPGTNPLFRISDPDMSTPNYSATGFSPTLGAHELARWGPWSGVTGGMQLSGFTESGVNNGIPIGLLGYHGGTSPTTPCIVLVGYRHNGSNNRTTLAATAKVLGVHNGYSNEKFVVYGNGDRGAALDNAKVFWGAAGATDSYIQYTGSNLDLYAVGGFDFNAGDLTTTGTVTGGGGKCRMTPIGGYAVKLTNRTGGSSVAGRLVRTSTSYDDAVDYTAADGDDCIGVFLDTGVSNGSEAWVVIAGIADVALETNTGSTHGNWVRTSTTEAGYADATLSAPPGGGIPEHDSHFDEIGHCTETVSAGGAGTHVLARCILHFN